MFEEAPLQRLLVVDDDLDLRTLLSMTLEAEGFDVVTASSAAEAKAKIAKDGAPHLAIVDIRMPGGSGLDFCRDIQKSIDLPVILLSAIDEERTVISAIEEVAEDYVTKPFNPKELVARIRRVLRRIGDFSHTRAPQVEVDDHLTLNLGAREVIVGGKTVSLTPTEAKILHVLLRAASRTVTTEFLLQRIWPQEEVFEDTLRVHVHRLRHKLEPNPSKPIYLRTVRGVGYGFGEDAG